MIFFIIFGDRFGRSAEAPVPSILVLPSKYLFRTHLIFHGLYLVQLDLDFQVLEMALRFLNLGVPTHKENLSLLKIQLIFPSNQVRKELEKMNFDVYLLVSRGVYA